MSVIASAPAKIILFGGHFVFGEPTIVTSINQAHALRVEEAA